jgi:hypothetical protein
VHLLLRCLGSCFSGNSLAPLKLKLVPLRGQLWLVSNTNLIAKRPLPQAAPDATFVTRHVSFAETAPCCGATDLNNVNNTVEGFLGSAHPDRIPQVEDLAFSGLYNSVVGAVVDGNTPVVNSTSTSFGTYGFYMRLEGTIQLANGQNVTAGHDGGVSLWIDGVRMPGFSDAGGANGLEGFHFTGLTGAHKIELLYADDNGPSFLSFAPKM